MGGLSEWGGFCLGSPGGNIYSSEKVNLKQSSLSTARIYYHNTLHTSI